MSNLSQTEVPCSETLLFPSDSARANLADMGNSADQEVSMSRRVKEIATEASWQAHYIQWTRIMGTSDPYRTHCSYIHQISSVRSKLHEQGWTTGSNPAQVRQSHHESIHPSGSPSYRQPIRPKQLWRNHHNKPCKRGEHCYSVLPPQLRNPCQTWCDGSVIELYRLGARPTLKHQRHLPRSLNRPKSE